MKYGILFFFGRNEMLHQPLFIKLKVKQRFYNCLQVMHNDEKKISFKVLN